MARDRKRHAKCKREPQASVGKHVDTDPKSADARAQLLELMRALARDAARADHRGEHNKD